MLIRRVPRSITTKISERESDFDKNPRKRFCIKERNLYFPSHSVKLSIQKQSFKFQLNYSTMKIFAVISIVMFFGMAVQAIGNGNWECDDRGCRTIGGGGYPALAPGQPYFPYGRPPFPAPVYYNPQAPYYPPTGGNVATTGNSKCGDYGCTTGEQDTRCGPNGCSSGNANCDGEGCYTRN